MLVQAGLCRTCSETTLFVFPRGGSFFVLSICLKIDPFVIVLVLSRKLDPVVQSIVSLTISLRHKFVKQISAKVTNTLLFFVEKYENPLCKGFSHFFNKK